MPRQEEKEYTVVDEAHDIVVALKDRYPQELWPVIPEEIVVLGITNKDRPSSMRKIAWFTKVTPEMKAMLRWLNSNVKYYIEFYCSDYQSWGTPRKQWVMFHELLHCPGPADVGVIKHDVEDFAVMVDGGGYDWIGKEHLPDLLEGEKFPWKQHLIDRLHKIDDDEE